MSDAGSGLYLQSVQESTFASIDHQTHVAIPLRLRIQVSLRVGLHLYQRLRFSTVLRPHRAV